MPLLTVQKFSCIDYAALDLRPMTVLIGKQASGKSVLAKLFYFFSSIPNGLFGHIEEGETPKLFKKSLAKQFSEWFPPAAWGSKEFSIHYESGPLWMRLTRKGATRRPSADVEIEISPLLAKHYETMLREYRKRDKLVSDEDEFALHFSDGLWRLRSESYGYLSKSIGADYVSSQIFIPAGRAFYTTLQRTVSVFEEGSQVDDITKRFGRLFISIIDGETFFAPTKLNNRIREFYARQKNDFAKILGGELKMGRNDRHLATTDGRKIPFSALSSGQQELVPLLLVTRYYSRIAAAERDQPASLLYIEEPEAHLFPSSQGAITSYLASLLNFTLPSSRFIITTHSPYVLSKLNTLIKAHVVGTKRPSEQEKVARIIPRHQWLAPANVAAYSLSDSGRLRSISDASGLIDADYLDAFSDELGSDFMRLLDLEVG